MDAKTYVAIDLKSFYASVECVERGLDPLNVNLVVADETRTEKTICLAVSPALKARGVPGRPRLFEVVQKVQELNKERLLHAPNHVFSGASSDDRELRADPSLSLDYIVARPQMAHYMECSADIYKIYLKYAAPEDIHVYSIDEVFIDATAYLKTSRLSAHDFTMQIVRDVLKSSGITATAGIGTNLYLCKVAMDIAAKHMPPDRDGVRIASLDEQSYRRLLWAHRPLTDFWRVGRGYAAKLEANGLFTMGDIARCSLSSQGEDLLFKLFGVNAELLIDHAWGIEPTEIADIRSYRPDTNSLSSGQVLSQPYAHDKAGLVVREMTDSLASDLVEKGLMTDQLTLTVSYDRENLESPERARRYTGLVSKDYYGRTCPKYAHGTANLPEYTSSGRLLMKAANELFESITDPELTVRRLNVTACRVLPESEAPRRELPAQLDLFTDTEAEEQRAADEQARRQREHRGQLAVQSIRQKYGKNAILKGMNLEEGATAAERNRQIGGHRA